MNRALKLFNNNGFVNVRLQHIADFGGISVGHLAYHFKHKENIVEVLYDELKETQETSLYEFRMAYLFEDINRQLRGIFQCQKHYLFFYLDTLEVLRAYPSIKEKHQQHITWQIQQIEWMFNFNVDRNTFKLPVKEGQYNQLAWLFWMTMDNWMYARQIKGLDHLREEDFITDLWSLLIPYLTAEAEEEIKMLSNNSNLHF
ncbi:MAG: TetR family transcriptional regulator [Chitinophagales bacterium]|nr:TetR family transcriptional regulator [Chitinophagales bacterium]